MKYKIIGTISAIGASLLGFVGFGGAALITPPEYATIINTTSTAFGTGLFTDLLPWLGIFILISVAGLLIAKLGGSILGAMKRLFGGGKKGRGGRGFRGRR